jgi:outer membrane receptor protein involved in Fe transport
MRTLTRFAVVFLLLLAAAGTQAQSITGTVSGTIVDEQGGALPGAAVTLTGKTGSRSTVTDAKGLYRFVGVDSGTYSVTVELTGFRPRKIDEVPVTIGKTADASFTMKVGGLTESVDVLGESPLVDVTSSATDNNLSQDLLFNMPIRYGNVAGNLLNSLPGINSSSAYGGDASSGNALLIDGVDTRDPSGGTPWTFYNFNIVEEVQAVGIGAPAEFGSFSGAVINTLTKSGGNRYSGLFDITFTNSDLAGDNLDDTTTTINPALGDPAVTNEQLDFTTQLGGPLIKDKLFFFVSAQRYHLNQDPTGPRSEVDEVSPRFNGKLTWQPSPNDILTGTVQFDSYNIFGRADIPPALATDDLTNQEDAPEWVWLTSWRHLFGSRTFTEVKYTGWWGYYDLSPKVHAPQHYDGETGLYSVSQGWAYAADRGRHQVNASISHFAEGWGRHDLKFGVEVERSKTRDRNYYINGKYYYDYGGQPYLAYSALQYDVSGRNRRESVFLQDAWKPTDRLTLNLGVRLDHVSGGEPGEDAVYSNTMLAPRIGFAFDLTGRGATVLKGSYSQYYEGIFNELYQTATSGYEDQVGWDMAGCPAYPASGPTAAYSCPASAQVEISRLAQPIARVDPDVKHPRVDEYSLGLEHQFGANWRVSATGVYRENKNFMGRVLPDARWEQLTLNTTASTPIASGCDGCSAWPGGPVTAYRWANIAASSDNLLITNPDGFQYRDPNGNVLGTMNAYRKYKAAMFTVGRRLANRWQAQLSYVYSKTEGTITNTSRSLFRSTSNFYETPTLGLVNADGIATNDRPHEVKVFGGWEIPKIEVLLNASYRYLSGRTYAPFQVYGSSAINYSATTYYWGGSSGRSPFVDDRGSRRFPNESYLDLRIEKVFNIAGSHRLAVFGDFLNILDKGAVLNRNARTPSVSVLLPDGSGDTASVPFEGPTGIQAPRQIMLGARWSF